MRIRRKTILVLTLLALSCAAVFIAPAQSASTSSKPRALKLLINGKRLPITPFAGPDRYNPIHVSTLRVLAKWTGNLTGTGYRVQISTREPSERNWRTCKTGTSCRVRQLVPIHKGQEFSWVVRILKVGPHVYQQVGGFMVCLIRNATPS
jgi:hypothetical protein